MAIGSALGVADSMQQTLGVQKDDRSALIMERLDNLQTETNSLAEIDEQQNTFQQEQEKVSKIEENLSGLEQMVGEFRSITPQVMVSPFRSEVKSISTVTIRPLDFFAPAVISLLLQHLSLTFAALSIVHEKRGGSMELFRVAPISSFETLLGKYLSYLIFASLIAVALTLLVIYGLDVPLLGGLRSYSLSLLAINFASLGIGFVISLLAKTDSQAVQYSMIFLLCSIFFSGAFLNLSLLGGPVRAVVWALPATYGIQLLQSIMLRGTPASPILLGGLIALWVVLALTAGLMLRRTMARQ
jgi:ABC-2 type transport system permease protein